MSRNRTNFGLAAVAAVLVLLTGASCFAQGLAEMEWFETTDDSRYGGGNRPHEGFFFSFDGLFWYIGAPETTTIGKEGLTREVFYHTSDSRTQFNTHDTSNLTNELTPGNRYEFGFISGHHGFFASWFDMRTQTQRLAYGGADIVFEDAPFGPGGRGLLQGYVADIVDGVYVNPTLQNLPISFDDLTIKNTVEMWGTELMYKYRMHPGHHGGIVEFFAGARYLVFDENFDVEATGEPFYLVDEVVNAPRTVLFNSYWYTEANNHIIGPQVGLRWFRRNGRFTLSTESRFFAGVNFQSIHQLGVLGDGLNGPLTGAPVLPGISAPGFTTDVMRASPFKHTDNNTEWAPGIELRLDGKYQLTEAIAFRIGWTGLFVDGIVRASNVIDYQVSSTKTLGIRDDNYRQNVFVQGINFGLDINY